MEYEVTLTRHAAPVGKPIYVEADNKTDAGIRAWARFADETGVARIGPSSLADGQIIKLLGLPGA